ncbi:triose-phosphate transporter family-domain-containing protein [Clohesyomyces aquaticus]|uniref:Triose-phosphate transporter family-domain-containing protein n=1 Tax=Clohesyomyces aquaticus TaxID=1231657 RepID=A0A1Y1ZNK9_9PLEO|nr:triose-phosphate transporter family-domain-containing protein [Clohesyomyces aquaticus]
MSSVVASWLQDQSKKSPAHPDALLHPADEFPLATISNPPSLSSNSDIDSDEDNGLPRASPAHAARLIHPPTPTMDEHPAVNHARRRSSSLAGAVRGPSKPNSKEQRRTRSEHIPEGDEDNSASDSEHSDSSGKTESTDLELDDMRSEDGLEDDEETGLTGRDRRQRRRRKRRNTRLDQRVVEEVRFTKDEEKLANQSLIHSMLINTLLIGLWYLFSISISVYNKWMFKQDKGDGKIENIFPFPLFTTCLHMIVQFSLASLVLFLIPSFRPRHDSLNPHVAGEPLREPIDPKKPLMTRWFYLSRIGPCGAATGMDIGLGNTSLKFISLTFFTMCKSSALGFVLLFAFLFRLEKPSWRLVFIIGVMTVGVVMMVAGEAAFDALGFILVMASACSSGFRWSLTQILLLRNPATANPFSSIFFLAPVMFLSLIVLAIPVEGFSDMSKGLSILFEARGAAMGIGILIFPGCLAFLMTASEFALLKRTSVVTLSICGIFKEVVTITTANFVFKDPLTPINLSGLVITICSIGAYNYMKIKKMRDEARVEAHIAVQEEYAPVLTADPDRVGGSNTRSLIRNSISLAPGVGVSADRPTLDSPSRASPVKRPEDLE